MADLTGKPTTIAGYGITDALALGTTSTTALAGNTALYADSNVDTHLNQSNPTSGYVLSWNGSDYAWVANSSAAGGSTTQVQFNDAGAFDGDSDFTYNSTTNTLTVPNISASLTSGLGVTNLTSASTITLTTTDGVRVTGAPFRLPSFTTTQRDALTSANGDMIYNTTLNKAQVYENGGWASLV